MSTPQHQHQQIINTYHQEHNSNPPHPHLTTLDALERPTLSTLEHPEPPEHPETSNSPTTPRDFPASGTEAAGQGRPLSGSWVFEFESWEGIGEDIEGLSGSLMLEESSGSTRSIGFMGEITAGLGGSMMSESTSEGTGVVYTPLLSESTSGGPGSPIQYTPPATTTDSLIISTASLTDVDLSTPSSTDDEKDQNSSPQRKKRNKKSKKRGRNHNSETDKAAGDISVFRNEIGNGMVKKLVAAGIVGFCLGLAWKYRGRWLRRRGLVDRGGGLKKGF